jgi:hypothetical protein
MKTAMQELISELKSIESYDSIVQGIIKRAESKLEKEREQLLNAFRDDSWDKSFNEYYNQTFNQNK